MHRVSVMSLNLWNTKRWEVREPAVRACLETVDPDIACFQELRPQTRDVLDATLSGHSRVEDPFDGWAREGNIFWRDDRFDLVEYGAADVGMLEADRRLFWARLQHRDCDRTTFVSTAHFTYAGNDREVETGHSPRVDQAERTVQALDDLVRPGEPALFMGDLNDSVHPLRILREAGYTDCFSDLGVPVRPTFPAWPTKRDATTVVERPLDWIFANDRADSLVATVPEFFHAEVAPSDHWPVLAMYELTHG